MIFAIHRCITIAACLLSAALPLQARQPAPADALIPAAAFYRPADIERVALSPSGRWLAMANALGGTRTGLAVFDLQTWQAAGVAVRYTDADIDTIDWVGDERLVFTIVDRTRGSGDQRWWPGLFSVKRDGSELRRLVKLQRKFLVERSVGREALEAKHELLHVPAGGGNEVIVGEWQYGGDGEFQQVLAERLDVVSGRSRTLSMGVPAHVWSWLFDPAGEPRVVVTRYKGRSAVHWRAPGSDG